MAISKSIINDSLLGISYLSKRELEVTIISSESTDRNKLSLKLNIASHTVDSHFKNILLKLSLSNKKEVMIFSMDFKQELEQELVSR